MKVFSLLRCVRNVTIFQIRFVNVPRKWKEKVAPKPGKRKNSCEKALELFDALYASYFGEKWPTIRIALLCQMKFCAVINNFADADAISEKLEHLGAIPVFSDEPVAQQHSDDEDTSAQSSTVSDYNDLFHLENSDIVNAESDDSCDDVRVANRTSAFHVSEQPKVSSLADLYDFVPASKLKGPDVPEETEYGFKFPESKEPLVVDDESLHIPSSLKSYVFAAGKLTSFPAPLPDRNNLLGYYLMDAASLLPVLLLNIVDSDSVLDLCAAPGGKSLTMLMCSKPEMLVCNDSSLLRLNRLRKVFASYVPSYREMSNLKLTQVDGQFLTEENAYDKVLVDVPCTTDRHSVLENENNWFSQARLGERMKLPELQSNLLCSAIKAVKPGGVVVYSTCSLSPVQNDGVIQMTFSKLWETSSVDIVVQDTSHTTSLLPKFYRFHKCKYGQLVLPSLLSNFGPMYFIKPAICITITNSTCSTCFWLL